MKSVDVFVGKKKLMVVSEAMWSCLRVKPDEKNGNMKTSDSASAPFQNPNIHILVANLTFSTDYFSDSSFSLHILHFCENCIFQTGLSLHPEHLHVSTSLSL